MRALASLFLFGAIALAQSSNPQFATRPASANQGEQRIVKEVRHELVMQPYYSLFDDLEFQVNGNTVTLLGSVVNPSLKSDAENAVKGIEGIEKVDNQIKILPPSSMDDRIRRQEARAILGFDGLSKYSWSAVPPIHIIVDNGHVTLKGVVDSTGDKNLANTAANQVSGVFSVTNDLQVAGTASTRK